MTKKGLIYWDSCTFLGWFKSDEEPERAEKCLGTIEEAKNENIYIVTSAITLTEVIKLKNENPISVNSEEIIKSFFDNKFIKIVNLERWVATDARNLIWRFPHLKPKDSIHVATALRNGIQVLHTFDQDLLKLNGQFENLIISEPNIKYSEQRQLDLVLASDN